MYTNLQLDELESAVERAWDNINKNDYITPIPQKATIASLYIDLCLKIIYSHSIKKNITNKKQEPVWEVNAALK